MGRNKSQKSFSKINKFFFIPVSLPAIVFCFLFVGVSLTNATEFNTDDPAIATHNDKLFNVVLATGDCAASWGRSSATKQYIAIKYVPSHSAYLCQVDFALKQYGSPTDGVQMSVYTGGNNPFLGTLLVSSANAHSYDEMPLSGSSDSKRMSYWFGALNQAESTCYGIYQGTTTWFVFERTGSLDNNNAYCYSTGGTQSPSSSTDTAYLWSYSGGTWAALGTGYTLAAQEILGIGYAPEIVNPNIENSSNYWCSVFCPLFIPEAGYLDTAFTGLYSTLNSKYPFVGDLADYYNISVNQNPDTQEVFQIPFNGTMYTVFDFSFFDPYIVWIRALLVGFVFIEIGAFIFSDIKNIFKH
jgi:hypothetical protein